MTFKESQLEVGDDVIIKVKRNYYNCYNYTINIETNDSSISILLDGPEDIVKIIKFLIEFLDV